MHSIGTQKTDEFLYQASRLNELETPEERENEIAEYEKEFGEVEMPRLKPDKFSIFDFYFNGKPYTHLDDLMLWISENADELPSEPREVIKLFEAR